MRVTQGSHSSEPCTGTVGGFPPGAPHTDLTTPITALALHPTSAYVSGGLRNCSQHTRDGNLIFQCRMGRWLLEEVMQHHDWEKGTFFPPLWTDSLVSIIQRICWWRSRFRFRNPNHTVILTSHCWSSRVASKALSNVSIKIEVAVVTSVVPDCSSPAGLGEIRNKQHHGDLSVWALGWTSDTLGLHWMDFS